MVGGAAVVARRVASLGDLLRELGDGVGEGADVVLHLQLPVLHLLKAWDSDGDGVLGELVADFLADEFADRCKEVFGDSVGGL